MSAPIDLLPPPGLGVTDRWRWRMNSLRRYARYRIVVDDQGKAELWGEDHLGRDVYVLDRFYDPTLDLRP